MSNVADGSNCYVSPNNQLVLIAEKAILNIIYLIYLCYSFSKDRNKFQSSQKCQLIYFGLIMTFNTLFAIMTQILQDQSDGTNDTLVFTLEQLKGISNTVEHKTIMLLFLFQLSILHLIQISLDERNRSVDEVLKRIERNQRKSHTVFYVLLSVTLIYIFFLSVLNLIDWPVHGSTTYKGFKIFFVSINIPMGLFIIYMFMVYYVMGRQLYNCIIDSNQRNSCTKWFKPVMLFVFAISVWQ